MKEIRLMPICVNGEKLSPNDIYERFPIDRNRFKITIDKNTPEYLIVSISHIIYRDKLLELLKNNIKDDVIIVFDGDEAVSPDLNIFDYAITYEDVMGYEDRICHRPFDCYVAGGKEFNKGNHITREEASKEYDKRKFCNFIYSNPKADRGRDLLFYEISKYKQVDSLGKHLNNMSNDPDRETEEWFGSSVDAKKNYRFSISAENGRMRGYTSEKIVSSFLAGSIPIYWGNPNIEKEFNSEAFINCNNFSDHSEMIDRIRNIEENKELWIDMVTAQWQTEEQRKKLKKQNEDYYAFVNHIFEQDISDARRRPSTTAACCYVDYMLRL